MAQKIKILIADKLSNVGLDWLKKQADVEIDIKPGLPPAELAKIVGEYDGMIIRSGVKVTAEVLANPGRLRAVARAGVGVDNVDVPTATAKGVYVMNTPDGNTVSTAELALALMMALSRKIAPANASLLAGKWDRKSFEGTQLGGKTLGVVGLGRIGRALAKRANGLEMKVLGFDPFLPLDATVPGVEILKDINELCRRSDYISVHTPKSPQTLGMIGPAQFAVMKPAVRLINAARGGIIDEDALLKALNEGKAAGAGMDVYMKEPPESEVEKALIAHPKVLAVPHLGASTEEAQEQVALEAAEIVVGLLRGGQARNAVNKVVRGS
jgi:D-3-phosphoglycerate dehydrogenase